MNSLFFCHKYTEKQALPAPADSELISDAHNSYPQRRLGTSFHPQKT